MPARGGGGELRCHCNRVLRSWCRYGRVMQSRRSSDRVVASRWLSHGEFKFAVAVVGPRSPLGRGAPALSCSAKASHGARGDRVLRRHPHRACSRIDATALRVRGQKRCGARLRSRLRECVHGCNRSVMRVRANDLDVTAALVRTVCCDKRVLKLISRKTELASTTEILISRQRSFSASVFLSCDTCRGKIDVHSRATERH